MTRHDRIALWALRVVWVTLPLSAGGLVAGATSGWDEPIRIVCEALAWMVWALVLVAIGAPRPVSLSVVRCALPVVTLASVVAAFDVDGVVRWTGLAAVIVSCLLALSPMFATCAVDGASYGDERRYPLRVPPALLLGPLPLAVAATAFGVAGPVLLLAARQWLLAGAAIVVGVPVGLVAVRAIHGLSRRMVVLVPAGLVVADPSTIDDAVLFRREYVRAITPRASATTGDLDLRLGAHGGSVLVELLPDADAVHVRRGRHDSEAVDAEAVSCAIVRRNRFLEDAGARRLPVRALG